MAFDFFIVGLCGYQLYTFESLDWALLSLLAQILVSTESEQATFGTPGSSILGLSLWLWCSWIPQVVPASWSE